MKTEKIRTEIFIKEGEGKAWIAEFHEGGQEYCTEKFSSLRAVSREIRAEAGRQENLLAERGEWAEWAEWAEREAEWVYLLAERAEWEKRLAEWWGR